MSTLEILTKKVFYLPGLPELLYVVAVVVGMTAAAVVAAVADYLGLVGGANAAAAVVAAAVAVGSVGLVPHLVGTPLDHPSLPLLQVPADKIRKREQIRIGVSSQLLLLLLSFNIKENN